ncbi:MAG: chorismate mutase [Pseudomonadota bacterium]|nr:chorismate mutase [Pseudomonadota bacterium]
MAAHIPERIALTQARGAIDRVDDGLLLLLAARRRLVASLKASAGVPPRDLQRELNIRGRAERLAVRLDLPKATVQDCWTSSSAMVAVSKDYDLTRISALQTLLLQALSPCSFPLPVPSW